MKRWLSYAGVGLLVTLLAAAVATALAGPGARPAIAFAAALSYVLQLVAFAAMLLFRRDAQLFMAGWIAGMMLRFGAVGAVAFWLSRSSALPRDVTLISLATFVVLLLFLEPLFLKPTRVPDK